MSRYTEAVLGHLDRLFKRGTVAGLSEGKLLERFVAGGDEAAFAALVVRHGPMVLGVCRRILRDEHDVEDAFQATFLVLVRRAGSIRDGDLVGHWLYGVAHRVAVRARAHGARRHAHEPAADRAVVQAVAVPPSADSAHRELRSVLDEELARLPDSLRAPVVLCYLEGLTHEEAAQRLGCPVGTVRSRLARARDRLRRRLARRGFAGSDAALTAVLAPVPASIPTALLDATVKASLGFATHKAALAVTSATAAALANGVLTAMMLAKLKVMGAAALACVVALAGVQTYAYQYGGLGIGGRPSDPDQAAPKTGGPDPQAELLRRVDAFQAELAESTRRNAELQDQLKALRAELEALRSAKPPATAKSAPPKSAPGVGGMEGMMPGMMGGMGKGELIARKHRDPSLPQYTRIDQDRAILVISPEGDRATVYYPESKNVMSLQLSKDKATPREVGAVAGPGFVALYVKGPNITRTAVFNIQDWTWYPLDLREPVDEAMPSVGRQSVVYTLGHRIYAFSGAAKRWDVLELPEGTKPTLHYDGSSRITYEHDGHIYTFGIATGKWDDLDIRAILDAPEGKGGSNPKPEPPR